MNCWMCKTDKDVCLKDGTSRCHKCLHETTNEEVILLFIAIAMVAATLIYFNYFD